MVDIQRELAKTYDLVLDGRDIGTFVLPDANCKIFLVASPEERAKRRVEENRTKGQESDFETVLNDIKQRDYNDSHREVAPLKKADDAVELDTTSLTIPQVVEAVINLVKEKIK
jgi:cytidylate kinase